MKKIRNLLIALAAGMAAVSCVKSERLPEPPRGGGERTAVPVSLAPVQMTAVSDGFTKAAGELTTAEDARIYDLWAIQYDGSGNIVGVPYYTDQMPAATAGSAGVDSTYGMTVMLSLSTDAAGKVYFIANTHSGALFTEDNVAQEADLKAMSQTLTGEYKPAAGTGIPMVGLYTGAVNSLSLADVEMKRLAAKILLRYKSSLPGFEFKSVRLINASSGMYYAPEPAAGTDFPAAADDSHFDYPAEDLTQAGDDAGYKTFVWYVPENCRKAVAPVLAAGDRTLAKTDGKATCIEITGVLREGDRCRKGTLRVLLGDLGAGGTGYDNFDVRRNTAYTFTVDMKGLNEGDYRLTVEDYDMSNSAMIQPGGADSVVFDIRKCLHNGFITADGLKGMLGASSTLTADILWQDAQNVLTTADVQLDKVNGLLTVKSSNATVGNAVVALYPNANKKQGEILWSWHIWVTDYQPGEAGVSTRAANTAYPVTGGEVHTYGAEFQKTNGLGRVIMDRNLGATKAYYAAPAANDATADQCFGMFYQWGRKDPFPRADGTSINATSGAGTTISIYGADGSVLAEGAKDDEAALGYKRVAVATALAGQVNGLSYATKNPLTFICNSTAPMDWYTDVAVNQNNDLWGDKAPKSPYDPCPKGWRVPFDGIWKDFTRDEATPQNGTFPYYSDGIVGETYTAGAYRVTNGRIYNNQAWYPAAGFRNNSQGLLVNVGHEGSTRSSMASGTGGLRLYYSANALNPSLSSNRGHGLQVRCIQYVE